MWPFLWRVFSFDFLRGIYYAKYYGREGGIKIVAGKEMKNEELGEKNQKGKKKGGKLHEKNGEKGLKNASL